MYHPIDNTSGFNISNFKNVEFVNPIEYSKMKFIQHGISHEMHLTSIDPNLKKFPDDVKQRVILRRQLEAWEKNYNDIISCQFPDNFFNFLTCRDKKKQERILKGFHFDTDIMEALIYSAWIDYGFSFSFYKYEKLPSQFQNRKFPTVAYLEEDGTITKSGETDMSDGDLRSSIEQRNFVFAKFLDNGKFWHCFLYTYDSLTGKEVKQTPHIHYISSAFGSQVTRERVLTEIRKGKYRLPSMLHLTYTRYPHLNEE